MKKSIGLIALILVAVIAMTVFLGCGGASSKFVGTWVEVDENGEPTGEKLVLTKNGEGSISDSGLTGSVKWSVEGSHVFITVSMCGLTETEECSYKFSGKQMTLTKLDSGETSTYIKQ